MSAAAAGEKQGGTAESFVPGRMASRFFAMKNKKEQYYEGKITEN